MISICVYTTFSVKHDVAGLASKVAILKKEIRQEQERIDVYKAEWASLTGGENIEALKHKLMPDLKIVSVEQMENMQPQSSEEKFAQAHSKTVNF